MSANLIPLSYVFNVSVATPQTGAAAFNTGNLAIFTRETYNASTFGTLGYAIYLSPYQVGIDFGTSSKTYLMAVEIFSQQPNILTPGGYLVVIPYLSNSQDAIQQVTFPSAPASGHFELVLSGSGGGTSSAIQWNDSAATIQTNLRTITALSSCVVTGSIASGTLSIDSGASTDIPTMTVTANTLVDANSVTVTPTVATTQVGSSGETLDKAIARTQNLIQYFGCMTSELVAQDVELLAAAVVQSQNKMLFLASNDSASIATGGLLQLLAANGFTQSRGLYYGGTLQQALNFMASYAALGMSTNYNGNLTTQTMNLKNLVGNSADPSLTTTLLNQAVAAGVDTYPNFNGVAKVWTSGINDYFDNQINLQWFATALQIAGFNALAQTNTKVPQTENGMNILKNALRAVCEQAVTNGFIAPGAWTSPTTFGNQQLFYQNIAQRGYYIYSQPVAQQLPTARALRQAPLIQIAIKYAGAIQSGSVVVNVNP